MVMLAKTIILPAPFSSPRTCGWVLRLFQLLVVANIVCLATGVGGCESNSKDDADHHTLLCFPFLYDMPAFIIFGSYVATYTLCSFHPVWPHTHVHTFHPSRFFLLHSLHCSWLLPALSIHPGQLQPSLRLQIWPSTSSSRLRQWRAHWLLTKYTEQECNTSSMQQFRQALCHFCWTFWWIHDCDQSLSAAAWLPKWHSVVAAVWWTADLWMQCCKVWENWHCRWVCNHFIINNNTVHHVSDCQPSSSGYGYIFWWLAI